MLLLSPWLVGKLRHSAGTREGPAEFGVLTVTQRLFWVCDGEEIWVLKPPSPAAFPFGSVG